MIAEDFKNKFDLSPQRKRYCSEDCGLASCPECGLPLIEDSCTVIILDNNTNFLTIFETSTKSVQKMGFVKNLLAAQLKSN